MIKDQERFMLGRGKSTLVSTEVQQLEYERLISVKYSDFKSAKAGTIVRIYTTLDLVSSLLGSLITDIGATNTKHAWSLVMDYKTIKNNENNGLSKRDIVPKDFRIAAKNYLDAKLTLLLIK